MNSAVNKWKTGPLFPLAKALPALADSEIMKKFACLLALLVTLTASAVEDQFFYGAWFSTYVAAHGAPKDAGAITIAFFDLGNVAGIGSVVIEATQNADDTYSWQGMWETTRNPNIIRFTIPKVLPGDTSWTGLLRITAGQLTGTYRNPLYRGKFQMTRLP